MSEGSSPALCWVLIDARGRGRDTYRFRISIPRPSLGSGVRKPSRDLILDALFIPAVRRGQVNQWLRVSIRVKPVREVNTRASWWARWYEGLKRNAVDLFHCIVQQVHGHYIETEDSIYMYHCVALFRDAPSVKRPHGVEHFLSFRLIKRRESRRVESCL